MSGYKEIKANLKAFKAKYYKRQLSLGLLTFLLFSLALFFITAYLEYQFWLKSSSRIILLSCFIVLVLTALFALLLVPLYKLKVQSKILSDEEAAKIIAQHFPEMRDKLLNIIQLKQSADFSDQLLQKAIEQKSEQIKDLPFAYAINFSKVKKYAYILSGVIAFIFLASFINPQLIKESPTRIINFEKIYEKEIPFKFLVTETNGEPFKGEDYQIALHVQSDLEVDQVYIVINNQRNLLSSRDVNKYRYTFKTIRTNQTYYFETAGYTSKPFNIVLKDRPQLLEMSLTVTNPKYLGGKTSEVRNSGNLIAKEGATINWDLLLDNTQQGKVLFPDDTLELLLKNSERFRASKTVSKSSTYEIVLANEYSKNKNRMVYDIEVIPDKHPEIDCMAIPDSISFDAITIGGMISDDYGISDLNLNYAIGESENYTQIAIPFNQNNLAQSFFKEWIIDTLQIEENKSIKYFVSVLDNDGYNGPKETRSQLFSFTMPSNSAKSSLIKNKTNSIKDGLENSSSQTKELNQQIEELKDRLKSERKFGWQEKKMLSELLENKEKISKEIEKLKQENQELQTTQQELLKKNKSLAEKSKRIQDLIKQLSDPETEKLLNDLKKLLDEEKADADKAQEKLDQLQKSEKNLEKDLERALELFRRMKMENALQQNMEELKDLAEQQDKLAEDDSNDLAQQEEIKKEFEKFEEQMDEVREMNQDLKKPEPLEDNELKEKEISKELNDIKKELQNQNQNQKDSDNSTQEQQKNEGNKSEQVKKQQQQAAEKMKALSASMSKMQAGMQMESMQENLDNLRNILDDLIKLSFNQEEIMLNMREVKQSDPRFLVLSQDQLKLKEDAKVIEDSLISLASRVAQLSAFINREVDAINDNLDQSISYLKERNKNRAVTNQQFTMTAINNLALLLDDTMQNMQMQMSQSQGGSEQNQQKPQGLPDLQQAQEKLGQKISDLKKDGKDGQQLSEELSKLAAEQEFIRQQLQQMKESQEGQFGNEQSIGELQKAIEMMEQNEIDIVNKRLTEQLIARQKPIISRMLEADKAQREQDNEEERESQSGKRVSRKFPPKFEEYLQQRKKEVESLKAIPLKLTPYYEREVTEYYKRLRAKEKND